jgi:hypothetical protein
LNKFWSTKIIFAHLYSFPLLTGSIILLLSLLAISIPLYKKQTKHFIVFGAIMAIISLILMVSGGGAKTKAKSSPKSNEVIKLVEWNAANTMDKNSVQEIFGFFDADIAIFPELEGYKKADRSGDRLKDLFTVSNIPPDAYDIFVSAPTEGNIAPVTVVIKKDFGEYYSEEDRPMTRFGTLYIKSKDGRNPDIIGLHTAPPLPGLMNIWKMDLDFIGNTIAQNNPNAIIAGDFNATMRHGAMNAVNNHDDVLNYMSSIHRGTWSVSIPRIFRTPIDHILLPLNKYSVENVEIVDLKTSDHLAVFAEIRANEEVK